MQFEMDNSFKDITNIKVIGVGGGGGNAINRMVEMQIDGVELITVNTDKQALCFSKAPTKIQIGEKITGGRGAGANPEIGRMAADESREAIEEVLNDTQMVFITAGMGGGTGTGAAPVIAEIARSKDILTVGIVTKPFAFEGKHRMQQAEAGIAELAGNVDSLIIIPNERLKNVSVEKITLANGFKIANDVLVDGVRSISDLIVNAALINLDFADVTAVMKNAGHAHMGIGRARGKDRAEQAVKAAITSPLLESTIDGATGVIICFKAPEDVGLEEIDNAAGIVRAAAAENANIIFGVDLKPEDSEDDEMVITVIATGFGENGGKPSAVNSFFKDESPLLYPMDDISSTSSDEASGDSSNKYSEFIDIINGKK
ncbi:MAG: cell division protein FtsZ [Ruminococcus sp.]|nr:cell division protein FtsZ [Ruminococcus sp.]MDY4909368.1 cell division protein FtsZ [Candidatus Fimenecus sp.]